MAGHDRDVRTLAGSPGHAETLGGPDLNDEVRGMVSPTLPDEAVNRKGAPASQVEGGAPPLTQTASGPPPQPSSTTSSKGTVGQSAPRLRPARARVVGASRDPDLTASPRPGRLACRCGPPVRSAGAVRHRQWRSKKATA